MKYLLLLFVLLEITALAQTEWPAGEGICRGRWTFERWPANQVKEHGTETEICETNAVKCGFEEEPIYESCRHKNHGWGPWGEDIFLESSLHRIWWEHHYMDKDRSPRDHCRKLIDEKGLDGGPNKPKPGYDEIMLVDYGNSHYKHLGKNCIQRKMNKCQRWRYQSEFSCFVTVRLRDYAKKATKNCPEKGKKKIPKTCCHTPTFYKKRTRYSGPSAPFTDGNTGVAIGDTKVINTTDDVQKGGRVADTEQCRTGDDLQISNYDEAQIKFNYLKTNYLALQPHLETATGDSLTTVKVEIAALLDTFRTMYHHHTLLLSESQYDWLLETVTDGQNRHPSERTNSVIDLEE